MLLFWTFHEETRAAADHQPLNISHRSLLQRPPSCHPAAAFVCHRHRLVILSLLPSLNPLAFVLKTVAGRPEFQSMSATTSPANGVGLPSHLQTDRQAAGRRSKSPSSKQQVPSFSITPGIEKMFESKRFDPSSNTTTNKGEIMEHINYKRARMSTGIVYLGFLSFMISAASNERMYENKNEPDWICQSLKIISLAMTLWLFRMIIKQYMYEFEMLRESGLAVAGAPYWQSFTLSSLAWPMVRDLICFAFTPIPFVDNFISIVEPIGDVSYSVDSIIMIFMLSRVALIFPRHFIETSGLRNEKTRLVGLLNNVDVNGSFIMKHLLNSSLSTLLSCIALVSLSLAYALMLAERGAAGSTDLDMYENAIWCIIITMTTVGYGDVFPKTQLGRLVSITGAFSAVVLVALSVNAVTERLQLKRNEGKVLDFIFDLKDSAKLRLSMSEVIQNAWRAYVQLKGQSKTSKHHPDTSHLPKSIALVPEFSHSLLEFHQLQSKKEPGDTLQLSLFWYVSSQAFFAGISTDVSLMVTELMESVKEIQSQLQENSDRISEGRDFTVRSS